MNKVKNKYLTGKENCFNTEKESISELHSQIFSQIENLALSENRLACQLIDYYENIISCMPGNVYWMDKNFKTVGCNKNVLKTLHLKDPKDFLGLSFKEMASLGHWFEGQAQSFEKDTKEVIRTGTAKCNIEEPAILNAEGENTYFLTTRKPLFNNKGHVIGIVGISTDITQQKRLEKALKEAKKQTELEIQYKTEFLRNMRHDLRTPISGIINFAEIIQSKADNYEIKQHVGHLIASAQALMSILNEILEVVQQENTSLEEKQTFNLEKQLLEVIQLSLPAAKSKRLSLSLDYDATMPSWFFGHGPSIKRIAVELVNNAIKFTDSGKVRLSTQLIKEENSKLRIEMCVNDTGIGIAEDQQEKIFDRFQRLAPSHKGIYSGTGLGLFIVKQTLKHMNAEITVDSKIGEGSTFSCLFDLEQADPHLDQTLEPMIPEEDDSGSNDVALSSHVLLVEDHSLSAIAIQTTLKSLGCSVDVISTGRAAVEKLTQNHHYDAVFMDVGLPDISGDEASYRVREQESSKGQPNVPIIALTAHLDKKIHSMCIDAGIDGVLVKPLFRKTARDTLLAITKSDKDYIPLIKPIYDPQALIYNSKKMIDIEAAISVYGCEIYALTMIETVVKSLSYELAKLREAKHQKNWTEIKRLCHKLKSAATYAGLGRLFQFVSDLDHYLSLAKQQKKQRERLYQKIVSVMEKLTSLKEKDFNLIFKNISHVSHQNLLAEK